MSDRVGEKIIITKIPGSKTILRGLEEVVKVARTEAVNFRNHVGWNGLSKHVVGGDLTDKVLEIVAVRRGGGSKAQAAICHDRVNIRVLELCGGDLLSVHIEVDHGGGDPVEVMHDCHHVPLVQVKFVWHLHHVPLSRRAYGLDAELGLLVVVLEIGLKASRVRHVTEDVRLVGASGGAPSLAKEPG